eukprot:6212129-Pleurochrysis_carterae.AAC.2
MEDKEVTINAPAHSESGERTSKCGYEDQLGTRILTFRVAVPFSLSWNRDDEPPPFIIDNEDAVECFRALVDSDVGTPISHTVALTEAVVLQVYKLVCGKNCDAVPPERPSLAALDLHAAERKLLSKWDSVPFSECIFDAIPESVAPTASESGPAAASASGASSMPSDKPTHHADSLCRALGKPAEESREKPLGAWSCTDASHKHSLGAGTCSSTNNPFGSSSMMPSVGEANDGTPILPGRTPTICIPGILRPAAHGYADADADAPATPASFAAGRHAATYEL